MAYGLHKECGIIALHLNETELEAIDQTAQRYGMNRSNIVMRSIQNCSLHAIFSGALERQLKKQLQLLTSAVSKSDWNHAAAICEILIEIPRQTSVNLISYRPGAKSIRFVPRHHDGITKSTSIRVSPECVAYLREVSWISGLTMTDVIIRLVTRRYIPDRQITKIKLLFQLAIKMLRQIQPNSAAVLEYKDACKSEFEQTLVRLNHDF
jgi:hypothetical protein